MLAERAYEIGRQILALVYITANLAAPCCFNFSIFGRFSRSQVYFLKVLSAVLAERAYVRDGTSSKTSAAVTSATNRV